MRLLSEARERLRALFFRAREEQELDAELRFHLEMETEANLRKGMRPEEARRRARIAFGGVERVKEEVRDARGFGILEDLVRDVHYAARALRKQPAFVVVAVLTLGLGIGTTTAIFSVVNGVLLRSLPYQNPERLVWALEQHRDGGLRPPSYLTFRDWQAESASLRGTVEGIAFVRGETATLRGETGPEPVAVAYFTPGFFGLMGMRPLLGRTFSDEEERVRAEPTAVISHAIWRQQLGGDPSVVGRQLDLNGVATTIIGVMPPDAYPNWGGLWQPIGLIEATDSALHHRGARADSRAVVRIAAAADSARAAAALGTVARRLAAEYPAESEG